VRQEKITIGDRLIVGLISAMSMGMTVIVAPMVFLVVGGEAAGAILTNILNIQAWLMWVTSLMIMAGLTGIAIGPKRTIKLFTHLWGTHRPPNLELTFSLWCIVIGIAVACRALTVIFDLE